MIEALEMFELPDVDSFRFLVCKECGREKEEDCGTCPAFRREDRRRRRNIEQRYRTLRSRRGISL
jgi:hypothetical protein